ncbi:zinc finger protein without children [Oratosquilla oratoria]|uniref:zinc finger protein without children n=1 Tax=Oratosquilla oratoria TaxID=337810 RepID=UPI003F76061E
MDSNPDSPEPMEFMGEDSSGSEERSAKAPPAPNYDPLQTSDTQGSSSLGGDQNIIGSEDIVKLLREGGEESIHGMDDMSRDPISISRRSSSGGNEGEGNEEMRDPISVSRTSPEGSVSGSAMGDEVSRDHSVGDGSDDPPPKGMNLSSLEEFVMQETSGALDRDRAPRKRAGSRDEKDGTGSGSQFDKRGDSEANRASEEGDRAEAGDKNESGGNDKDQDGVDKEPSASSINEASRPAGRDTTQDEARGQNDKSKENPNSTASESETMETEDDHQTTKRLRGVRFRWNLGSSVTTNGGDSCDDPDDPDPISVLQDGDPISTGEKEKQSKKRKTMEDDDDDDIVEVPVIKKPAMVVDLSDEEEDGLKQKNEDKDKDDDAEGDKDEGGEKDEQENPRQRVLLRSLTSLMNSDDSTSNTKEGTGDIEHGDIIGAEEVDGMHLKISSVMSGEDCITGLTFEDETDGFPNIQISSVTSILDEEEEEQEGRSAIVARDNANREDAGEKGKGDKDRSGGEKDGGGIRVVNLESLAAKTLSSEDKEDDESSQLRITTVLSDAVVEERNTRSIEPHTIYHILHSPIMSQKQCKVCGITKICQYRITHKPVNDTIGFLCSSECRSMWTGCLSPGKAVEKARILFDKVCGLCGKDISSVSFYKYDIYAWETREFCSKKCLVSHLQEVASKCHRCNGSVRTMYIGKYCVRFGSDIHQFCSNVCLEQFKSTIEVCNYCQKNLKGVSDITTIDEKKYCGAKCARRAHRTDIGQRNYNERDKCTVCSKENTCSRYELINNSEVHRLCSDPCLNAYKYANKLKAVVCCLCLRVLNAETVTNFVYHNSHQLRIFCSDSCMNVFILTVRKIVVCRYCMVKKYNFDMIHKQEPGQGSDKYYCSVNCLTLATQNQNSNKPDAVGQATSSSTGTSGTSNSLQTSGNTNSTATSNNSTGSSTATIAQCNMCGIMATPQYHMVMSDNTLCNFCNYSCAIKYKSTYGYHVATTTASGTGLPAPEPTTADASTGTITQSVPGDGEGNLPQIKKSQATEMSPVKKGKQSQTMADMLKLLEPPPMQNKTTMCRPNQCTKAVYCRPHPWHKGVQTDPCPAGEGSSPSTEDKTKPKGILPVPIPMYVPSPMMMYNAPCPVPLFIPLPVPVPIFIPTTAKTSEDVARYMKGFMEKMRSESAESSGMMMLTNAAGEGEPSRSSSSSSSSFPSSSFKQGKEGRTEANDVASPGEGTGAQEGYSACESGMERRGDGDEREEDGAVRDFRMEWEDVTSRLDRAEERVTERKTERENESAPPSPNSSSRDDFVPEPSSAAVSTTTPNSLVPADATTTNTSSTISPPTTPPASTTATASPATSDMREELENEEFVCSSGHEGGLVLDDEEKIYLQELIGNIPTYTIRHGNARGVSGEDSSKRLGYHEDLPPTKRFKADPRLEHSVLEVQLPTTLGGGPYLDQRVGLTAWRYWLYHKNAQLSPSSWGAIKDLLSMDCEELNQTLCLFLRDLRRSKRTFYQPDIIYYMLLGLQQFLFESGRTDCIFMDFAFEKFSSCFQEVTQSFLDQLAASALSSSVRVMTCIHEEVLWESKQLGAHTPHVLINSLFYFNTKVFRLKTVEEHMSLSFVQIVKQWRRSNDHLDNRTSLLKYFPKKGFREEGSDPSSLHELHENLHNPLRCPVKLYEFYLSKCPDSVRTHPSMYYVYPVRACDPDAPVWFSNQGVQPATLHKMLQRTLMVSEVQQALGAQVVC